MKTLVLSGLGLNCENETAFACRQAGAEQVDVRHINEIYGRGLNLAEYRFLVLIGGFLDGDDLGGGQACANRFRYREKPGGGTFLDELHQFVANEGLVLGICNGFQLLVKLGLLSNPGGAEGGGTAGRLVTLSRNANGRFEDRWVRLTANESSPCIYTRGIKDISLPIRHGEGRIVARERSHLAGLVDRNLVPLQYAGPDGKPTEEYPHNPNGSAYGVASLCNETGRVFGLMPHPEAFNHSTNHPQWTRLGKADQDGDGLIFFKNAYQYLQST